MANVTQSLFGFTPQDIQAQRAAELDKRTAAFAQLTPMQQAQAGFYRAGSMFGDAAAGALGYEDPEMAQARARQGLLGGLDIGDPQALRTTAANADPQTANLLISRAMELEKSLADVDAAKALADQRRRADRINFGADREAVAKAMYEGKSFNDLTPLEAAAVNKRVVEIDLESKKAGAQKTTVDLGGVFREVFAKEDAKGQAESWKTAGDAYNLQVPIVGKLRQIREALPRTFTGAGAETFLNLGKAMSTFGIPVDPKKLSNTEYFDGVSSQLVQTIAKNFPGSQAIKELEQLIKSKPNFKLEPETITRMLDDLDLELNSNIIAYEKLDKLPEKERYQKNPNVVRAEAYRQLSRYRELENKARQATKTNPMSKADVEEAKRLKQELGVK